jgi:hypothetical protein
LAVLLEECNMSLKKILAAVFSAEVHAHVLSVFATVGVILVIAIVIDLSRLDGSAFWSALGMLWAPVFAIVLGVAWCAREIARSRKSER